MLGLGWRALLGYGIAGAATKTAGSWRLLGMGLGGALREGTVGATKFAAKGTWGATKALWKSPGGKRTLIGAGVGAGVGAMSDDVSVLGGALAGGLGARYLGAGLKWGMAGKGLSLTQRAKNFGSGVGAVAKADIKDLARMGAETAPGRMALKAVSPVARAAMWGIRNPYAVVGGAGTAAYIGMSSKSPYESPSLNDADMSLNIDREAVAMQGLDTGVAPSYSMAPGAAIKNQRLMESTVGLVQGLHSGRH